RAREEAEAARLQQAEAEAAARRAAAEQVEADKRKADREQRRTEVQADVARGRELVSAAQWDAARQAFEAALQKDPNNATAHAGLGDVAFQQQRFADAVTHHRASVAAAPKNAGYHVNLGMAYYRLKNFDQAKVWWQKALELQPGNAQAARYLELVNKKLE
ncbi:MAG: tetratricopeptide repeat protein, partial [Myxococcales bacterium]|nr:tetratricopeptide repeat protein [Myxococcales bacterium]